MKSFVKATVCGLVAATAVAITVGVTSFVPVVFIAASMWSLSADNN